MNDLEKRFHQVMGSMIGNESLFESLDDIAAGELFSWGEATAKRIVDETDGMDDDAAEEFLAPRLRALRMLLRAVSRWAGEADILDSESRSALWARVGEQARVVFGGSFVLPSLDEVIERLPSDADAGQVVAWMITLFDERKPEGWTDAS
jgi:hypothetical protein